MCRAPAIDIDDLSGKVRGVLDQKSNGAGDVVRTALVFEQGVGNNLLASLGPEIAGRIAGFRPKDRSGRDGFIRP